jgi:hypothetical protein
MKGFSVSRGSDLTEIVGRVRLALKRDDGGSVTAAQFLHLSDDSGAEGFYLVTGCEATRGAVNGSTTLALALCAGDGFPPVALLNSREPAPCNVARATDAEVIAAIALATGGSAVHLNPPTPRPTRADKTGLRPVEFDCAPPVAGKCGTRGQRFEPESLETVSILSPSEGSAEWASAVEVASEVLTVTDEPAATEPVMEASPEVASDEPAPVMEPAATETEPSAEPAPVKGKRRKG